MAAGPRFFVQVQALGQFGTLAESGHHAPTFARSAKTIVVDS
jgi:hypothetical protein